MFVESLHLTNFRSHSALSLQFHSRAVILSGPNGVGKTSVLEALNTATMSKSFLPVGDEELVRHGATGYSICARIVHDIGTPLTITIEYNHSSGKTIHTSASEHCTAQDLIGLVPCVVLAASHRELFVGEPSVRRAFVDRILAQSSGAYKHALWRHRTALRQRNRLLASDVHDSTELDAWTEELLASSVEILWQRKRFTELFNGYLSDVISDSVHVPIPFHLEYAVPWLGHECQPHLWNNSRDELQHSVRERVSALLDSDRQRMTTQWGPQRDIFAFIADSYPLHTVASQGQQKVALVAIKIVEAQLLHSRTDRAPILLLDDVFSDLDAANARMIGRAIAEHCSLWQIFLTAPTPVAISDAAMFQHIALPISV
ncbi:MAG: DNA replication and repair protein RecF [Chlorobi bacterium]|nr:DNA replication and repair protein RecF [Chlorobiota bacterium]